MPAVRTQQAEDLIPDTAQTSLPRVGLTCPMIYQMLIDSPTPFFYL